MFVDNLIWTKLGAGAIRGVFGLLNRLLKMAAERGILFVNPCKGVRLPKSIIPNIEALTGTDQKKLEQIALHDKYGISVLLALYTGMRIGEICALKWADIDLETGILRVRQTMQRIACRNGNRKTKIVFDTPKSEKSNRLIPLPSQLQAILSERYTHSESEYVVSCRSGFTEPRAVRYRYYQILKKARIKRIHFHALRHTFATRCMELRFDVTTLSRLLGHSSIKMTLDIYTDSLLEHKIVSMHMLDRIFPVAAVG